MQTMKKKPISSNYWKPFNQTTTFLSKPGMKNHREKATLSPGMQFHLLASAKTRISIKMRNSLMKLVKFSKITKRLSSFLHLETC